MHAAYGKLHMTKGARARAKGVAHNLKEGRQDKRKEKGNMRLCCTTFYDTCTAF